ncbi:MAG: prolyl oligopeptidase family serine peptidase [Phycisphaerales bacterium]|nr:prolyl oligopeptidase family serine peptidase [Phycisphaerales bacterium]
MTGRRHAMALGLLTLLAAAPALSQTSLESDLRGSRQAVATWGPEPPAADPGASPAPPPMIDRLRGIATRLGPEDLRKLALMCRNAKPVGWPADVPILGHLHLVTAAGTCSLRLGLTHDRSFLLAEEPTDASPVAPIELSVDGWESLLGALRAVPPGAFSPEHWPLGEVFPLQQPYQPSLILLDDATVESRLAGGRTTRLPATDRSLSEAQFLVRMPARYDPTIPVGLLVWIDAGDDGRPPDACIAAADEFNLVMIGAADAGNSRLVTDRYQLALDAVATLQSRLFVDTNRVYITGISGGGRVASAAVACFADIFTGAVPIVGLSAWKPVPLGDSRYAIAGYYKPEGGLWRLFRTHRVAPMTGSLDFNHPEICNAVRMAKGEGLAFQLFDYEGMGHEMPTPEHFAEAMRWVDEPARLAAAASESEAQSMLEGYARRFEDQPADSPAQRRILERIVALAPWSPPAWRACQLLGIVSPDPPPPHPDS